MWHLLWLLLPVASATGWYAGYRRAQSPKPGGYLQGVPIDYLLGVNYLINEQHDRAVDVFIKMLEVDGDTVETHLALGSLFRRRGEVDRAIRIHQNIIARPQLAKAQRVMALIELGKDYLKAGVLDRAERIFQELVSLGEEMHSSLEYLLGIYEQQKDWQQAIHSAQKLIAIGGQAQLVSNVAQYYCEMAVNEIEQQHLDQALYYLKRAASVDKLCIRVSLLQAKIHMSRQDFKSAIKSLERVQKQQPDFISEVIAPLGTCYEALGRTNQFIERLRQWLQITPRISIVLVLTNFLIRTRDERMAIQFLAEQIREHPSLRGLQRLIQLYLEGSHGDAHTKLTLLNDLVEQLLTDKHRYRCHQCGFSSNVLYWHCPGCKTWNNISPIHGIEGD